MAYDRFLNNKTALFDYSDVTFETPNPETDEIIATLGLPTEINPGSKFNGVISINRWDNEAEYKLIDFIVTVPEGVSVVSVTAGSNLAGGKVAWNLEKTTGKLRVVYFDANENSDLTVSSSEYLAELFSITFQCNTVTVGSQLPIGISGMSVKKSADSSDQEAMVIVNTQTASGVVNVVAGISFSAICLYEGDGVDLIPVGKKAVAVAVTSLKDGVELTYDDGTYQYNFLYSDEISAKTGVATYVALVDASIDMENFVKEENFDMPGGDAASIDFGDVNGDGIINAQDALAVVDAWLRKTDAPSDDAILTMNVNADSRINTFDVLGIVEKFVNGTEYAVVTKAAMLSTKQ